MLCHEAINPWMVNEYMAGASYEELMQEDLRIIREEADALMCLLLWWLLLPLLRC